MVEYKDKIIICLDCGKEFLFTKEEQSFYIEKGFLNEPMRCGECRYIRRERRNFNYVRGDTKWSTEGMLIEDQVYLLGKGIKSNSLDIYIPPKEIIVPMPQITEDIAVINSSLLEKVKLKPIIIHELSSREFEELICELFDKRGYKVKLTQKTKDGGKDIIIVENNFLGNFLIYVECKKYRPDRPIGVELIRQFYGVISMDNVTAGMFITSSYFSRDAVELTQNFRHRINLMDYINLVKAIQTTGE